MLPVVLLIAALSFAMFRLVGRLCAELLRDKAGACLLFIFAVLAALTQGQRLPRGSVHTALTPASHVVCP